MPGPKGQVRNPITVILLSMVTCNIYAWWWWYTTMKELKEFIQTEEINPSKEITMLLVLPCIWQFLLPKKVGQWIVQAQRLAGLPEEDKSGTYLILSILCLGVVAFWMIQNQLNAVWQAGGAPQQGGQPGAY